MTHRTILSGTSVKTEHNNKIKEKVTIINNREYKQIQTKSIHKQQTSGKRENVSFKIKYGNMFVIKNIPACAYNIHNFTTRFISLFISAFN